MSLPISGLPGLSVKPMNSRTGYVKKQQMMRLHQTFSDASANRLSLSKNAQNYVAGFPDESNPALQLQQLQRRTLEISQLNEQHEQQQNERIAELQQQLQLQASLNRELTSKIDEQDVQILQLLNNQQVIARQQDDRRIEQLTQEVELQRKQLEDRKIEIESYRLQLLQLQITARELGQENAALKSKSERCSELEQQVDFLKEQLELYQDQ